MNYSRKHVSPDDIIRWVKEAIVQKAKVVAVVTHEESHDADFEPRYLKEGTIEKELTRYPKEGTIEKELIALINQDDEKYALRFVIDVEYEIQESINAGEVIFDLQEAKKAFPGLKM